MTSGKPILLVLASDRDLSALFNLANLAALKNVVVVTGISPALHADLAMAELVKEFGEIAKLRHKVLSKDAFRAPHARAPKYIGPRKLHQTAKRQLGLYSRKAPAGAAFRKPSKIR